MAPSPPGSDAPPWLDELGFEADGPPWLTMGLRKVDESAWLLPDERRDAELAERDHLLAERHEEVMAARIGAGTEAAGAEVLELVRAWFRSYRPGLVLDDAPSDVHPLEAAGRILQEDLCLMVERGGVHHLDAACLCFPSHWRLADKIGRPTAEVHGPVPGYPTELSDRVDRYLARLRPDAIGARRNWSVHTDPALFAPVSPDGVESIAEADVDERLWLRSERQTLRALPRTSAVLFTIRVQQTPFASLAARPAVAAALHARLATQPDELTAMNGLAPHRSAVLAWLAAHSPSP